MCARVVPALTGLAAPYWDQYARGTIIGITRGTKYTPPLSGTVDARSSISDDEVMKPNPSRNHCTTEPPT